MKRERDPEGEGEGEGYKEVERERVGTSLTRSYRLGGVGAQSHRRGVGAVGSKRQEERERAGCERERRKKKNEGIAFFSLNP